MDPSLHPRLLLALLTRRWDDAERLAADPAYDGAVLYEVCREGDVLPWLHRLLAEEDRRDLVGRDTWERFDGFRRKIRRDNLLLLAHGEAALDALATREVPTLALKGFDLLHRLYGSFDERRMTDIDLLVPFSRLRAALAALEEAGFTAPPEPRRSHYVRSSHHLPLRAPGPVELELELHWNLAQRTRFAVDPEAIFARAVPLAVSGREVLRMENHDLAAHLLLHHFTHYFDPGLKWAVDLHLISACPGFEWSRVAERIRDWEAVAATSFAVRHLRKMVPEWIPAPLAEALPVARWRDALTAPLRSRHPLELFGGTRRRSRQLFLAAAMLEHPAGLPGWIVHRLRRGRSAADHPLETTKENGER